MHSCDDELSSHIELYNEVKNIPLRALELSIRVNLSLMLDPPRPIPTKEGLFKDWQGVAQLAEYDYACIVQLRSCSRPTEELLALWEQKENATIGLLIEALSKVGRFDVIDDLYEQFEEVVTFYKKNSTISVWENNKVQYTRHDTIDAVQNYDAYVCYTEEDEGFVHELVNNLEGVFKFCIKKRDLLPKCFEHKAIVEIIQRRCNKVLIILSPAFLASPTLEFQTLFAHSCSLEDQKQKVIPVIYKSCTIPYILKSLAKLDYSKNAFNLFWNRLKSSLNPEMFPILNPNSLRSLSNNTDENLISISPHLPIYYSFYSQQISERKFLNSDFGVELISQEVRSCETAPVTKSEISESTNKKKKRLCKNLIKKIKLRFKIF